MASLDRSADAQDAPALKVAVIVKFAEESSSPLELQDDGIISITRPDSNLAAKLYGPFFATRGEVHPLFSSCCADDLAHAVHTGTSYGVLSFGGCGNGKTTAMWGGTTPEKRAEFFASLNEKALVPSACARIFALVDAAAADAPGDEWLVCASFLRVSATRFRSSHTNSAQSTAPQ